jgi:hypothetical protein
MAEQLEITYGDKVFKLSAGQKCTFKGGKVMQSDIVAVVSASEGEVALISFTISGTTYYSPEGWTWEKWVADTTYNTAGAYIEGSIVRLNPVQIIANTTNQLVSPASTIIDGYNYKTYSGGGGAD